MAEEIFEVYSDSFEAVGNPYGTVINFNLSPPEPHSTDRPETVVRVRVSWEMAKVLTAILLRFIKKTESERSLSYPVPLELLNTLKIAKEDWDALWADTRPDIGGID